jgi:hypothetical protein
MAESAEPFGYACSSQDVTAEPSEAQLMNSSFYIPTDQVEVTEVQSFEEEEPDEDRTPQNRYGSWTVAGENFGLNAMDDVNVEFLRIIERLDCIFEQIAHQGHDPEIFSDMVDCIEGDIGKISNEMEVLFDCGFNHNEAMSDKIGLPYCRHKID